MYYEEYYRKDLEVDAYNHTANWPADHWVDKEPHFTRKELAAMSNYDLKELYREYCTWHTDNIDIKFITEE